MAFRVLDALPLLVIAYGETINKVPSGVRAGLENQKVMGFRANTKVLAVDVEPHNLNTVKIWIEPPLPAPIPDVTALPGKISADLRRRELRKLSQGAGVYLQVASRAGLLALIDRYR